MESWQADHISNNLAELTNITACTVPLLESLKGFYILSEADIDYLASSTLVDRRVNELYEILRTRVMGYEMMTKALYYCRQYDVMKILLKGFSEKGILNPLTRCQIPISCQDILTADVHIQGATYKLNQLFKGFQVQYIQDVMDSCMLEYDYIDIFVTREKQLVLIDEHTKSLLTTNMPSTKRVQVEVNDNIFRENCSDVFVFKCIQRNKLSQIAHPNITAVSSDQLLGLTSRFILLDDDIDWEEIQTLAMEASRPVHLIKFVNEQGCQSFTLESTVGNSHVLQMYLQNENQNVQNAPATYQAQGSSGFYICDPNGPGKHWLYANIPGTISLDSTEARVVCIQILHFVANCKDFSIVDMTKEKAFNLVLRHISPTHLSRALLLRAITTKHLHVDLFFDGLDDLAEEDKKWTTKFLMILAKWSEDVKVCVRSLPLGMGEPDWAISVNA